MKNNATENILITRKTAENCGRLFECIGVRFSNKDFFEMLLIRGRSYSQRHEYGIAKCT